MDVYKIGVSIALANGMSAVLSVIQKDVLGLKKAVDMLSSGFTRMQVAAAGFGAVTLGGAMLVGLSKLEKAGEKYTHQLDLMRDSSKMTFTEIEQAQRQANETARQVLTSTPTENLKAIRELRAVFPHYESALRNLTTVQKASAVMANMRDAGGNPHGAAHGTEQVYEMSKAAEMQGAAMNPERFTRLIDGMVKASQWSGGKLTGGDFHSMLKYMRGAGINLSDRFLLEYLPSIMQEFKTGKGGSSGVGVGFAGLMRYIVGGHMSQRSVQAGLDYDLIDPSKVIRSKNGSIKGVQANGFYGGSLAQSDPDQWVDKFFLPALQRHNVDLHDNKKVTEAIASVFEGRVSQQFLEQLALRVQRARLEADRPKITGSGGTLAYNDHVQHDPTMVRDAFHAQLERIAEDLGKAMSPAFTEFLYSLTQQLAKLANLIERHPVVTRWILGFIAALAGLLVVLGTIAVAGAALSALGGGAVAATIAGIIALGAAVAWLATGDNWSKATAVLKRGWDVMLEAIPRGWAKFASLMHHGWDVMLAAIPRGWARFTALISHGWDVMREAIPRGWGKFTALINHGWDVFAEALPRGWNRFAALMENGWHNFSEGLVRELGKITDAIMGWLGKIPGIAASVGTELEKVGSAILAWVSSLPGKIGAAITSHLPSVTGPNAPGSGVMGMTPDQLNRHSPYGVPHDGSDPDAPARRHPTSYTPPPVNNNNVTLINYTTLDGQVIAKSVSNRLTRSGSGPSAGMTGFDQRGGFSPGMAAA